MSSHKYSIVEPHPSVSTSRSYLTTGRGGAGNTVKVAPTTLSRGSDASGPASRAPDTFLSQPRSSYISGRGGAGNHYNEAPRMFSFDEELQHQMAQEKRIAPVYHVGRGGAGNLHSAKQTNALFRRTSNDSASSASSTNSAESGADIATRNLKKGLKKLAGVF